MIALMATIVAICWKGRRCDRPCHSPDSSGRRPRARIRRIRLSEKTHAIAVVIACDAACNDSVSILRQVKGWDKVMVDISTVGAGAKPEGPIRL
jgi:hypothetical protein